MATRQSTYPELIRVIEDLPIIARERRRKKRMTLQEAADACGLSKVGYWGVENPKGSPNGTTIIAVLKWCSYK